MNIDRLLKTHMTLAVNQGILNSMLELPCTQIIYKPFETPERTHLKLKMAVLRAEIALLEFEYEQNKEKD